MWKNIQKNVCLIFLLAVALLTSGCDTQTPQSGRSIETLSGTPVQRQHDPALVARGALLYAQHCAQCHGVNGEGDADWRRRDADGMFPPPPLDGSGHAWHHPRAWLKQMILHGSEPGKGKMPAWQGKLGEQEAEAVIEWFQSLWPDQVYAAWVEMQR